MNEFQNGEVFQFDGIHQASSMYLADAAQLGRFDAGRLLILEREWKAEYDQVPINDDSFSFAHGERVFTSHNGELTFIISTDYRCFVLLGFELKPSTRGGGNIVAIETGLNRRKTLGQVYGISGLAARARTVALPAFYEVAPYDGVQFAVREMSYIRALVDGFTETVYLDARNLDARNIDACQAIAASAEDLSRKVIERQTQICDAFDIQARELQEFTFKLQESTFRLKRVRRLIACMMAGAAVVLGVPILWESMGIRDLGALLGIPMLQDVQIDRNMLQVFLSACFAVSATIMLCRIVKNSATVREYLAAFRSGHFVKTVHDHVWHGPRTT